MQLSIVQTRDFPLLPYYARNLMIRPDYKILSYAKLLSMTQCCFITYKRASKGPSQGVCAATSCLLWL